MEEQMRSARSAFSFRLSIGRRYGNQPVSAAVDIGVLPGQYSSGINSLKHRSGGKKRPCGGGIDGYWRRAGELHKPVLMFTGIDVCPSDFEARIDVPNYRK